jgi:hypothetical protein
MPPGSFAPPGDIWQQLMGLVQSGQVPPPPGGAPPMPPPPPGPGPMPIMSPGMALPPSIASAQQQMQPGGIQPIPPPGPMAGPPGPPPPGPPGGPGGLPSMVGSPEMGVPGGQDSLKAMLLQALSGGAGGAQGGPQLGSLPPGAPPDIASAGPGGPPPPFQMPPSGLAGMLGESLKPGLNAEVRTPMGKSGASIIERPDAPRIRGAKDMPDEAVFADVEAALNDTGGGFEPEMGPTDEELMGGLEEDNGSGSLDELLAALSLDAPGGGAAPGPEDPYAAGALQKALGGAFKPSFAGGMGRPRPRIV